MSKANNLGDFLLDIANAIRDREGITGKINPQDFSELIRGVPEGYTLLQYIESTGSQYINTGFKPNQDTRIVVKLICPVNGSHNWAFGARYSSTKQKYVFVANANGYYQSQYGSESDNLDSSYNTSQPFVLDKNKNVTYVNGDEIIVHSEQSFQCPVELCLFGANTNGSISYGTVKIYSCQIYDNGNLIRDFIPCKNPSGVYGLYDKVNKQFYASASSTPFTGA